MLTRISEINMSRLTMVVFISENEAHEPGTTDVQVIESALAMLDQVQDWINNHRSSLEKALPTDDKG